MQSLYVDAHHPLNASNPSSGPINMPLLEWYGDVSLIAQRTEPMHEKVSVSNFTLASPCYLALTMHALYTHHISVVAPYAAHPQRQCVHHSGIADGLRWPRHRRMHADGSRNQSIKQHANMVCVSSHIMESKKRCDLTIALRAPVPPADAKKIHSFKAISRALMAIYQHTTMDGNALTGSNDLHFQA